MSKNNLPAAKLHFFNILDKWKSNGIIIPELAIEHIEKIIIFILYMTALFL